MKLNKLSAKLKYLIFRINVDTVSMEILADKNTSPQSVTIKAVSSLPSTNFEGVNFLYVLTNTL